MRILAIRGKNLASLANEFEVLLEEGPLQHAGLFAITGQTGSGKSTLLDALCLALYDQIPRLPKGNGVSIGHKDDDENIRVNSHDVSSILRRGTASAYAEVDFIGSDKQTYRSRWEISRARNNVKGRLQPQKITLTNLQSQEIIGHKKTETLQEISHRIGLSFDQFRRSVLLAQGDFAAFLKAKKDERSSLLEKMTGTDIYSQLSEAAFDRATKEKQALTVIQEKLSDKIPLSKEERLALEKQDATLSTQLQQSQSCIEGIQKQLSWHGEQEQLQQQLAELQLQNTQINAQWDSQAEHRDLLKKIDEVQILRPLLQQQEQLDKDCAAADNELSKYQQLLSTASNNLPILSKQSTEAERSFEQHKKSSQDAQPLLTQAQILESQLAESQVQHTQLQKEQSVQTALWQTADAAINNLRHKSNSLVQALKDHDLWQEQHSEVEPLISEWGRWENDLKSLTQCQQELVAFIQQKTTLEDGLKQAQRKLKALGSDDITFSRKKNDVEELLNKLEPSYLENPLSLRHQERNTLEQEKIVLDKNLQIAEQSLALHLDLQRENKKLLTLTDSEQSIKSSIAQLDNQQQITIIQFNEAQQAFQLLQAANNKSVKELRASLSEDCPCSVCGSENHPWANESNPLRQPIAEQEKRIKQLSEEKENNIKRLTEQGGALVQVTKDLTLCKTQILDVTVQLEVPVFSSSVSAELIAQLKLEQTHLNLRYLAAQENEVKAIALQKQWQDYQVELKELSDKHIEHTKKINQLTEEIKLTIIQQHANEGNVSRETLKENELILTLSSPFSLINDWQSCLFEEPNFIAKIHAAVKQWHANESDKNTANESLRLVDQKIILAESECRQQLSHCQKIVDAIQTQQKHFQQLSSDRQAYFSGKPVAEVSLQLKQALQAAEEKQGQLAEKLSKLQLDIKTQQQAISHWQTEKSRRTELHAQLSKQLNAELQKYNISIEKLNSHLKQSAEWMIAQKAQQEKLRQEKQEIHAFLKVKQAAIKTHQETPAEQEKQVLIDNYQQQQKAQQEIKKLKESCIFTLRTDDEKIAAGQHLAKAIKKQTQTWEQWESLNDLIGSKNGQKFRTFAQGLTLETLLTYTNQHLQEFAKRYSLERVNGSDLELQVIDRDMADEIRSVHSLSGGESFLVSLALALGLASLSSNRIQVESLFIDEGFGSLDPETLDIAIASLDTLQSLGRKVAVISHVPALVERIGTQIKIEKQGGGHSIVKVISSN